MTSDEWLGIVSWLASKDVRLTADVAAKFGVALQRHTADQVRIALGRLIEHGYPVTIQTVNREIRSKRSRWRAPLEKRHRELFPRGCGSPICDLCLTSEPERRNVVLHD